MTRTTAMPYKYASFEDKPADKPTTKPGTLKDTLKGALKPATDMFNKFITEKKSKSTSCISGQDARTTYRRPRHIRSLPR